MTTRAEVLKTLRRLGYAVGSGDLAVIMDATSYRVTKALTGLYARDLIDRTAVFGGNEKFVYRAKAVSA
jgi:hypothetical protein